MSSDPHFEHFTTYVSLLLLLVCGAGGSPLHMGTSASAMLLACCAGGSPFPRGVFSRLISKSVLVFLIRSICIVGICSVAAGSGVAAGAAAPAAADCVVGAAVAGVADAAASDGAAGAAGHAVSDGVAGGNLEFSIVASFEQSKQRSKPSQWVNNS